MGNEESVMADSGTPPQTLEARSVDAVAKYIHEKKVRRIVVLVSGCSKNLVDCLQSWLETDKHATSTW